METAFGRRPSPPPQPPSSSPTSAGGRSSSRNHRPSSSPPPSSLGVDSTVARALAAGVPRASPPPPHAFNVFTSTPRYARIISPPVTPLTQARDRNNQTLRDASSSSSNNNGHTRTVSSPATMWASPLPLSTPHQRQWSISQGRIGSKAPSPRIGPFNVGHRRTRSPPQTGGGGDLAPRQPRSARRASSHTRHISVTSTAVRPSTSDSTISTHHHQHTDRLSSNSPARPIVPPLRLPTSSPQPGSGMMSSGFDRLIIRPQSSDGQRTAPVSARTPTSANKSLTSNPASSRATTSSRGFPYSSRGVVNRSDVIGATNYADRVKDYSTRTGLTNPVRPHSSRSSTKNGHQPHHPAINRPHRVFPPAFMNAPSRTDTLVAAHSAHPEAAAAVKDHKVAKDRIKDYQHRAFACRRAGRSGAEANAFFCMGIIYDNIKDHLKAVECYKQFLSILGATDDKFAQGLAHNSIGVAYQYLGGAYLPKAEYHHSLHCDLADLPGQFIAHTNLGLVYHALANSDLSMEHHRRALQAATTLQSKAGQAIAIGNLGLTGFETRDLHTARACMERHLELARDISDRHGQGDAFTKLGQIAHEQGDFEEAGRFFEQARHLAHDSKQAERAKVAIGVSRAEEVFDEHMRILAANIRPRRVLPDGSDDDDNNDDYDHDGMIHESSGEYMNVNDVVDEEKEETHDDSYYDQMRAVSTTGAMDTVIAAASSDIDELGIGGDEWIRQQEERDRRLLAGLADVNDDADARIHAHLINATNATSPTTNTPLSSSSFIPPPVASPGLTISTSHAL